MRLNIKTIDGQEIELIKLTKENLDDVCEFLGFTPSLIHNPNFSRDSNGNTNSFYLGIEIPLVSSENPELTNTVAVLLGEYVGFDKDRAIYCGTREYLYELFKSSEILERMNFGSAIELLKEGKLVTRKGWNGKGMYLWLKQPSVIKSEWCKDNILKTIADSNGGEVDALGTICMKTADNKVLTGWLASQTDMLADDWIEYTL